MTKFCVRNEHYVCAKGGTNGRAGNINFRASLALIASHSSSTLHHAINSPYKDIYRHPDRLYY